MYNAERAIAEARSSFPSWTREYSERALQLAVKVDPDAPDTRGGKRAFTDDEESTLRENLIIAADSDGNQYSMSPQAQGAGGGLTGRSAARARARGVCPRCAQPPVWLEARRGALAVRRGQVQGRVAG